MVQKGPVADDRTFLIDYVAVTRKVQSPKTGPFYGTSHPNIPKILLSPSAALDLRLSLGRARRNPIQPQQRIFDAVSQRLPARLDDVGAGADRAPGGVAVR